MFDITLLQNFLVAIILGALIGLEREYARYRKKGHDYAGIRTFPLIALFGALSAYLGDIISPWIIITGIILIGSIIVVSYFAVAVKARKYLGATSEVAGFLTFFIGMISYYGELTLAVTLAVIITIILYSRSVLHRFAEHIKQQELTDTLKFALIAFVILPFLPNKGYGPFEIFNPFIIWLMVVFISGISFAGYILLKWRGEKGIEIAGLLGGLIGSTPTTLSFSVRSKKEKKIYKALALGVMLANGVMFLRVLIEVFVINRSLFMKVLPLMLILIFAAAVFSLIVWRKSKSIKGRIELGSPFTLGPALKFALFFAVILALVKIANIYLSSKGVYLVSFISGFANMDAITVSLSQLARTSLDERIARNGIIIAALTNLSVKAGITLFFGGKRFGRLTLGFFVLLIVIGLAAMFLL